MSVGFYLKCMLRESRGSRGRFVFFALCLAVGVAGVVAVAALAAGLREGLQRESRQLLAADLVVEGWQPVPPAVEETLANRPGLDLAPVREMVTMVSAAAAAGDRPGRSQLVELKAVAGAYPFYGRLDLEPPEPLARILGPEAAVVAPDLLDRLGLAVGDPLRIGGVEFRIAGVVRSEPDRLDAAFAIGPRVFVSQAGLERTELVRFGSRVLHRLLVRLPPGAGPEVPGAVAAEVRQALGDSEQYRVETSAEGQPALRDGVRRVERFLGLVALLSLLVGAVGVAQTARAWLAGRMGTIAVLRCLGLRPREIVVLYLGQCVGLGLAGCLAGAGAGLLAAALIPHAAGGLLAALAPSPWQPAALLRGLALGLGAAVVFALPSLVAARRVPPLRVLRRQAEPLPPSRAALAGTSLALGAAVLLMAAAQAGSWPFGAAFTAGVVAATGLLALAARLLLGGLRRLPRRAFGLALRHGLAARARPDAGTVGSIVALGLGVLVVLGISLVQAALGRELRGALPEESPTAFLIDIQRDQWCDVERLLAGEGATHAASVPVVTARLAAVDGRTTDELTRESRHDGDRRWALTREQRLTYLRELPRDNEVVAGALWSDPERLEVSVEQGFAADLGLGLGSRLTFDVQGVPLELVVTSLRQVEWRTFGINFFLVAEPEALAAAPQARLAAARLPVEREQAIQDRLAARFPNVTLLKIREVLEKVRAVLARLGWGVRFLGGFSVVAGALILARAVSAGTVRRARELALLKTLGVTPREAVTMLAAEYALVGAVAGAIGTAGGALLAGVVLHRGLELPWAPNAAHLLAALAATVAISVAAGLAASAPALRRRPLPVLRSS